MEGLEAVDLINIGLGLFVVLGGIVYSLIKTKLDVDNIKQVHGEKIKTLFDLFNNLRDKGK
tara:strand:+ start:229 stop:411 length:183 start_codon:yes stop_codon:yes gene_type:complete